MSLRVTVVDEQTGQTETGHVPDGDYMILVTQPAYVEIQAYPTTGTHVITVKGRRTQVDDRTGPEIIESNERIPASPRTDL